MAIDDRHLRAVVRSSLRSHGFEVSAEAVSATRGRWRRAGERVRAELTRRLPRFVSRGEFAEITATPYLREHLPRMLGFGYDQAMLFARQSDEAAHSDVARAASTAASFSAGIALLDYLVDELGQRQAVFSTLSEERVRLIFEPGDALEDALASGYADADGAERRLLCVLVAVCARDFRRSYERTGNETAWRELQQLVRRLYEAQRNVRRGFAGTALEEKSVLPFVAVERIVELAVPRESRIGGAGEAALAIGRAISLVDDLVDLLDDLRKGVRSPLMSRIAEADAGGELPDRALYALVDEQAKELVALLRRERFPDDRTWEFARSTVGSWTGWPGGGALKRPRPCPHEARRAVLALLREQRAGYPDLAHKLSLPRLLDGQVSVETHPGLTFHRAVVLDALLDAYEAGLPVRRRVLDAEALAILLAKHPSSRGGWNYIAEVPELPPDADDLGMVTQVLARVGGRDLAGACDESIQLALDGRGGAAGISTWILDSADSSPLGESMRSYIDLTEAGGAHPDVVGNFLYALLVYEPTLYRDTLAEGARYLEQMQAEDGSWPSRWYAGPYYGTFRALAVLAAVAPASAAIERANRFLRRSQRPDGGWGARADPLSTALALMGLRLAGDGGSAANRAAGWLAARQEQDGSWPATTFVEFPHPGGHSIERYGSRTVTTAFCLKALLGGSGVATAGGSAIGGQSASDEEAAYGGWS